MSRSSALLALTFSAAAASCGGPPAPKPPTDAVEPTGCKLVVDDFDDGDEQNALRDGAQWASYRSDTSEITAIARSG